MHKLDLTCRVSCDGATADDVAVALWITGARARGYLALPTGLVGVLGTGAEAMARLPEGEAFGIAITDVEAHRGLARFVTEGPLPRALTEAGDDTRSVQAG
ncbi:MAG: hypothetical protein ACU0CO_02185 [Shimia sp.]